MFKRFKEDKKYQKKVLFIFCMISIFGFLLGSASGINDRDGMPNFLFVWGLFSLPMVIRLIYMRIYHKDENDE